MNQCVCLFTQCGISLTHSYTSEKKAKSSSAAALAAANSAKKKKLYSSRWSKEEVRDISQQRLFIFAFLPRQHCHQSHGSQANAAAALFFFLFFLRVR